MFDFGIIRVELETYGPYRGWWYVQHAWNLGLWVHPSDGFIARY